MKKATKENTGSDLDCLGAPNLNPNFDTMRIEIRVLFLRLEAENGGFKRLVHIEFRYLLSFG